MLPSSPSSKSSRLRATPFRSNIFVRLLKSGGARTLPEEEQERRKQYLRGRQVSTANRFSHLRARALDLFNRATLAANDNQLVSDRIAA